MDVTGGQSAVRENGNKYKWILITFDTEVIILTCSLGLCQNNHLLIYSEYFSWYCTNSMYFNLCVHSWGKL